MKLGQIADRDRGLYLVLYWGECYDIMELGKTFIS